MDHSNLPGKDNPIDLVIQLGNANDGHDNLLIWKRQQQVWGHFPSLYSQFYEVIILGSTYAIGEGKIHNVFLDIELCL
jgi:hypothetical protein